MLSFKKVIIFKNYSDKNVYNIVFDKCPKLKNIILLYTKTIGT